MGTRWGLGPLFALECLKSSRRWQFYAWRSFLVASVLVGLILVWFSRGRAGRTESIHDVAALAESLSDAVIGIELVLALAVVPAFTAGAVCHDRRGHLMQMMTTDLSDAEIVLGKLASRLVVVLGVIACVFPVMAIMTALGGISAADTLGATLVIVGVATLGASLALAFSVWADKPYEALLATYATFGVWLLALVVEERTFRIGGGPGVLHFSNPFWLLGSRSLPAPAGLAECATFFAGALAISSLLAIVSIWCVRDVALERAGRAASTRVSRKSKLAIWLRGRGVARPSLERHPMLWRKAHCPKSSAWVRAIWRSMPPWPRSSRC